MIAACDELGVELDLIEGVKHDEARRRYAQADVIVDQLVVGWYGLFAIESMATARPVVTYLHEDAVERTERAFDVQVPIVNATKETLVEKVRPLVESINQEQKTIAVERFGCEAQKVVRRPDLGQPCANRLRK